MSPGWSTPIRTPAPGVLVWAVCTSVHPYLVSGSASLPPETGGDVLVESAPINAVLSNDAAAGDQTINITGEARALLRGRRYLLIPGPAKKRALWPLAPAAQAAPAAKAAPPVQALNCSARCRALMPRAR
jgi:hypothetical protein